jgi:hypothetical protein
LLFLGVSENKVCNVKVSKMLVLFAESIDSCWRLINCSVSSSKSDAYQKAQRVVAIEYCFCNKNIMLQVSSVHWNLKNAQSLLRLAHVLKGSDQVVSDIQRVTA